MWAFSIYVSQSTDAWDESESLQSLFLYLLGILKIQFLMHCLGVFLCKLHGLKDHVAKQRKEAQQEVIEAKNRHVCTWGLSCSMSSYPGSSSTPKWTSKVISVATTNARDISGETYEACRLIRKLIAECSMEADVYAAVSCEPRKGERIEGLGIVIDTIKEHDIVFCSLILSYNTFCVTKKRSVFCFLACAAEEKHNLYGRELFKNTYIFFLSQDHTIKILCNNNFLIYNL